MNKKLSLLWIISALMSAVTAALKFVKGDYALGAISLFSAVIGAFLAGIYWKMKSEEAA